MRCEGSRGVNTVPHRTKENSRLQCKTVKQNAQSSTAQHSEVHRKGDSMVLIVQQQERVVVVAVAVAVTEREWHSSSSNSSSSVRTYRLQYGMCTIGGFH
jgi:hypothetical protein